MNELKSFDHLPIGRGLESAYRLSLGFGIGMAVASLAGLFWQQALYPAGELRRAFLPNDAVNLLIGLPMLLASLALARRGALIGLLLWPGALLYVTYNYVAYAVAMRSAPGFLLYVALAVLSAYTIAVLLSGIDRAVLRARLVGAVPERLAGGVLAGLGVLFFLRGVSQAAGALTGRQALAGPESAVLIADLLIMPLWVIGGILLWRKRALGYACGAGLLFQGSMLFIGLLFFFLLQPILTATPFPAEDFAVVFLMGLVCFVPFALFVRGVLSSQPHDNH